MAEKKNDNTTILTKMVLDTKEFHKEMDKVIAKMKELETILDRVRSKLNLNNK